MLSKFFQFNSKQKGFSIIEVVFALAILTIGVVGMFSLLIQNLQVQTYTKNKLIASMLAQEGVELVRNTRDQNWINSNDWRVGVGAGGIDDILQAGNSNNYIIRSIGINGGVSNINNAKLYLKNGFYNHDNTGTTTPFSRLITVSENDIEGDGVEHESLKLTSEVQWQQNNVIHSYIIKTMLFNWK